MHPTPLVETGVINRVRCVGPANRSDRTRGKDHPWIGSRRGVAGDTARRVVHRRGGADPQNNDDREHALDGGVRDRSAERGQPGADGRSARVLPAERVLRAAPRGGGPRRAGLRRRARPPLLRSGSSGGRPGERRARRGGPAPAASRAAAAAASVVRDAGRRLAISGTAVPSAAPRGGGGLGVDAAAAVPALLRELCVDAALDSTAHRSTQTARRRRCGRAARGVLAVVLGLGRARETRRGAAPRQPAGPRRPSRERGGPRGGRGAEHQPGTPPAAPATPAGHAAGRQGVRRARVRDVRGRGGARGDADAPARDPRRGPRQRTAPRDRLVARAHPGVAQADRFGCCFFAAASNE
mmetsp:Transcript_3861/g.15325  ORF Transcript_3861/g.15325 Transcript_3861/m.15325 type:complete len:354 (+) Transcript_3861:1478-2539(+)